MMSMTSLFMLGMLLLLLINVSMTAAAGAASIKPVVEAEEIVYSMKSPNNGAGPMWCYGSSCLARVGERVFISGLEIIPEAPPLNNVRWQLFERNDGRWERVAVSESRTREPCPLATLSTDSLYLSDNPTLTAPDAYNGPARPTLFRFTPVDPAHPDTLLPAWQGAPAFTEHSYRSVAADAARQELMLFQDIGMTHTEWSFRDRTGKWSAQGQLKWPWGADYPKPEPIRVCYPTVALVNRAVYFCGVSDIVEPYPEWREYKKQLTGKEWDYDFRRLFFTWSDDITTGRFHDWVQISSRDKTCGWISPNDLWIAPDGAVHLLWSERAIDERLREKFFPGAKQSQALMYAVVRKGKIVRKQPLVIVREGQQAPAPATGRFHITPEGRLFVIYFVSGTTAEGAYIAENRILEIPAEGSPSQSVRIDLQHPFSSFFTASWRNGSPRSDTIDLYGPSRSEPDVYRYARVRLIK